MTGFAPEPLARHRCETCAEPVSSGQNFCGHCGRLLAVQTAGLRTETDGTSLATIGAPPAIRDRNAMLAPDDERKPVTILFADVVGSTALIRQLDPESVAAVLDPAREAMTRAVRGENGLVSRILGDGIMALFGVPLADEQHALKACRAALRMRDDLAGHVPVRIGLHSGEVVLRATRGDVAVDYDVMGMAVHIAARLEQNARSGSILVSAATARLVQSAFRLAPVGAVRAKGAGRLEAFELLTATEPADRWRPRTAQGLSPLVGRGDELATMQRQCAAARAGLGQVLLISGPAGSGKSRLVHELTASCENWMFGKAAADPEDELAGYRPLAAMLLNWVGAFGSDERCEVQAKVLRFAERHGLPAHLPALSALLGLPVDDAAWRGGGAGRRQRAILRAFRDTIRKVAEFQPLLVVVEDLHWFADESRDLLADVISEISERPILVVITSRGDFVDAWTALPNARQVRLGPLDHSAGKQLVEGLLGRDNAWREVQEQVLALSQGNPLFIEEFAHDLIASAGVIGQTFDIGLAVSGGVTVPQRIQTILAARIDRLAPEQKRTLQIVSAVGSESSFALVAAVLGESEAAVARNMAVLEHMDLLAIGTSSGEVHVSFRHVLIREVAYGSMLASRRRKIHGEIAAAIETLHRDRLDEHSEALARHALGAGLMTLAVGYLRQSARKAVGRSAYRQARKLLRQAIDGIQNIAARDRSTIEQEIDLRLDQRISLGALGLYREWFTSLSRATHLAEQLGDPHRLLAVRVAQLHVLGAVKTAQEASEIAAGVADFARAHGTPAQRVAAYFFTCQACGWHGTYGPAIAAAQKGLLALEHVPVEEWSETTGNPAVLLHTQLAYSHAGRGEFGDALRHAEHAWQLAHHLERDYDIAYASYGLGLTLALEGEAKRARDVLQTGLDAAMRGEHATNVSMLAGVLGWAHLQLGDFDEALALTERALDAPDAMSYLPPWHLFYRALVLLEVGRIDEARTTAGLALRRARNKKTRGLAAWLRWSLARMSGDPASATRQLAAVARSAECYGMLPLAKRCYASLADVAAVAASRRPRAG